MPPATSSTRSPGRTMLCSTVKRFQYAVQPGRHEIVHEVVAPRDRIEDAGDALGLFVLGNLLEAEIRLFVHCENVNE